MADTCEFAYPEFADARVAATNVIAKIGGDESIDMACAVHCGWVVLGFGGSFIPHDHPPAPVFGSDAEMKTAGEAELRKLTAMQAAGDTESMKGINWVLVATFVARLIQEWLANR